MFATLNKHEEAIQLGLKMLASLHISIPSKPSLINIFWVILKINLLIGKRSIENISLEPMESKKYQCATELLSQLFNSAFMINQDLFIHLACVHVYLSLKYGYTKSTGFACIVYAFTVMHGLGWYKHGVAFSELYNSLSKNYPQHTYEGKNLFAIASFIDPYRIPLNQALDRLYKGYQYSYDVGDLVYTNYCNIIILATMNALGKPINDIIKFQKIAINFLKKTKTRDFYHFTRFWKFKLLSYKKPIFSLEKLHDYKLKISKDNNNTATSFFYSYATSLCYRMGYFDEACSYGMQHEKYFKYEPGLISGLNGSFYYALTLFVLYDKSPKRSYLKILKKIRKRIAQWTDWCPENFKAYLLLFDAEWARINNNIPQAIKMYNHAVNLSDQQQAGNITPTINECFGRFFLNLDLSSSIAKYYFSAAYYYYKQYGFITNAKLLEKTYPHWFNSTDTQKSIDDSIVKPINTSIDMLSLMKSTQIISSEIQLDKLLQKLLLILLQNAGANRVVFISKKNNNWYVEAEGGSSEQRINLTQAEHIDNRKDIPLSLIRYVLRTQETFLLQSSEEFETFVSNDIYLNQIRPESVLLIPIFYQQNFISLLYLEHRTASQAFKKENIHVLQILSSQAAISLQNARLYYEATHDALTGLANRNLFYQLFEIAASKANQNNTSIAILFLDLDGFKNINDKLGHELGDKLLLYIAEQIKGCLWESDIAVRLGGDEFIIMLENVNMTQINQVASKLLHCISKPTRIDNHEIAITSSIGISLYPTDGQSVIDLLRQADIALYRVKAMGKNTFQFYTQALDLCIKEEFKRELELRNAIEKGELCIYYQPVFSYQGYVTHFEALIRWNHPIDGFLTAEQFIPLAEKTGLIMPIGKFVLVSVVNQIKAWKNKRLHPLPVAVNISGLQLKKQNLSEFVEELLKKNGIDPTYLELEFTESVSIEYTDKVLADIAKLKKLGIKLTLDDFGTYYSSLSYLREGIIDKIKIDQSFVKDIHKGPFERELIMAIILMAHSLNLKVVAEGIETEEQMVFLKNNNVDELQGYYLGKPMSIIECEELLNITTIH